MASARFLWQMGPYARHVAGELVLGSACGVIMNTAVALPALLLGRAVDQVVGLDDTPRNSGATWRGRLRTARQPPVFGVRS